MKPTLANNLKVKAELVEASRAFTAAGVEHLVLKGVPLVLSLYNELDARWIGDNDLLVRFDRWRPAVHALENLGYQVKYGMPEISLKCDGRVTLYKGREGAASWIDLHVKAFDPLLFEVPDEVVWQHRQSFDLGGHELCVLDRELTLLHQAAHCVQHAMSEPRTLRDLARAWNTWGDTIEHEQLRRLAKPLDLLESLMFGLWIAEDLGMLRIAPPRWRAPRARRLRRLLPPRRLFSAKPSHYLQMALMGLLIDSARVPRFLQRYLFPSPHKMRIIHGEPPDVPLHPVRLGWRYAQRLARPVLRGRGASRDSTSTR